MPYPKEFSPVLFILLVAVCAYLLVTGKLSGTNFVGSILVSALAVVVIQNADVLQRLTFKGGNVEATADLIRGPADSLAWCFTVFHVAGGLIHLWLVFAVISLILHFVLGARTA